MGKNGETNQTFLNRFSRVPRINTGGGTSDRDVNLPAWSARLFFFLLICGLLTVAYRVTATPVTLVVGGQVHPGRTHQTSVAGFLREANIQILSNDRVSPPLSERLYPGATVEIVFARQVIFEVDGRRTEVYTQHIQLQDILSQANIQLKPSDEIRINGVKQKVTSNLPSATSPEKGGVGRGWTGLAERPRPLQIVIRRSIPVTLYDAGVPLTFYTTYSTVGEALLGQGVLVYLGDRVSPGLGSPVVPGLQVYIQRSTPATILADGTVIRTRTQRRTIGELLAEEGVLLTGKDYAVPPIDAAVSADLSVDVIRVQEEIAIETEFIPFESEWIPDPEMPIDTQQVVQPGASGLTKRRFRATLENGREVSSVLEDDWLDQPASTKVTAYGTHITVQTLDTPEGTVEYWRNFRVLATAYSAATSGKSKDHPRYGITSTGMPAGYGVIAVDPKVIPMGSYVYVPGYGKALAGDTGGAVQGRHIDLGFDEDAPPSIYRWMDVYLLTPVPAPDDIRYVLPNWPQPR